MQIQRVNNQPSFQAQFKLSPKHAWDKLSRQEKYDINKKAGSIGTPKDLIKLKMSAVIEDKMPEGVTLRHFGVYGATLINGNMDLYERATIARQGQPLKSPFNLITEALDEIKTAAGKSLKTSQG